MHPKNLPSDRKDLATKRPREKDFIKLNYDKIIKAINEAKFYPRKARMLRIEGVVKVKFLLKKDGDIEILSIITNKRFLKKAVKKIIQDASGDFPKPQKDIEITVPIEFRLRS